MDGLLSGSIEGLGQDVVSTGGPLGHNPFIASQTNTPYIPGLVGGAEVYGMTGLATVGGITLDPPVDAIAALVILQSSPDFYDFPGFDQIFFVNLTAEALDDPILGVAGADYYSGLLTSGYVNDPLFGGSGPVPLNPLPGDGIYTTLVPAGSTNFTFGADGISKCQASFSPGTAGNVMYLLPCENIRGDMDGDGDVDLVDFAAFQICFGALTTDHLECSCADTDGDQTIGLSDYAAFEGIFSGPGVMLGACCDPADASCSELTEADCTAAGGLYQGDGVSCANVQCPFGQYANEPYLTQFQPGANVEIADDMTLAGVGARELVYYDLLVAGFGGDPFDVNVALYTDCPGNGGTLITGTAASWSSVPNNGSLYTLSTNIAPVTIPDTVWMVVSFSDAAAVWAIAGEAELGFTANVFGMDAPPWGCGYFFTGDTPPYAGFWAHLICEPEGTFRGAEQLSTKITPTGMMLHGGEAGALPVELREAGGESAKTLEIKSLIPGRPRVRPDRARPPLLIPHPPCPCKFLPDDPRDRESNRQRELRELKSIDQTVSFETR